MKARWTPSAKRDRAAIFDYLEQRNADAAVRIDNRFLEVVAKLAEFPMMGRVGTIAGTREFSPHPSYRLVYQIVDGTVWVLTLIHTAREWPPPQR